MISIAYNDLGTLFPADNCRHFGGLSHYWPAAYFSRLTSTLNPARYHQGCIAYNWTEGLFSPISPSSLKIKLQSTVLAEELTQTTPSDKEELCFTDTTAEWSYGRILLRG